MFCWRWRIPGSGSTRELRNEHAGLVQQLEFSTAYHIAICTSKQTRDLQLSHKDAVMSVTRREKAATVKCKRKRTQIIIVVKKSSKSQLLVKASVRHTSARHQSRLVNVPQDKRELTNLWKLMDVTETVIIECSMTMPKNKPSSLQFHAIASYCLECMNVHECAWSCSTRELT